MAVGPPPDYVFDENNTHKCRGVQWWKLRSTHGPKFRFESPDQLWNAACEFFEWVEDNPLIEHKEYMYKGDIIESELPKMRAMTIERLCLFLGICIDTWYTYCRREDFITVTGQIRCVMRTQKFEGAAAELLSPNIIARDLGLKESTENTNLNANATLDAFTDDQLAARLQVLLNAASNNNT